ncbi:hypothetical protein ACIRYZ_38765 [Kitasatospora sp. NPDC101155]
MPPKVGGTHRQESTMRDEILIFFLIGLAGLAVVLAAVLLA